MNAEEYKAICVRPDVFRRSVLEATEQALLQQHLSSALWLRAVLESEVLPKPELHRGSEESDCFIVKLDVVEAEEIAEHLLDAEAGAVGQNGETTADASRFASLVDAWARYIRFCDRTAS
jgi:hypothetical protein